MDAIALFPLLLREPTGRRNARSHLLQPPKREPTGRRNARSLLERYSSIEFETLHNRQWRYLWMP
ncbi:hypothetical protein [Coleofasciculus sp. H7-2]|uniref:hypothetical protein n=1 Tax=Coleofasciculus sp. H7-2 TaxID=3351545 RepID=UPI00366E485F